MKKLSDSTPADFEMLRSSAEQLAGFQTADKLAQAFIDLVYNRFQESLVLIRLFSSFPYSELSAEDRQLVDSKAAKSGIGQFITADTPILTLLGTRGRKPDWNERAKSRGFRCIPLASGSYIASLSMLSMQVRAMNMDYEAFDSWGQSVITPGRADAYTGTLYVNDASRDRDEQGRMVVPHQDFVTENDIRTVLGFGTGYSGHPSIATLFIFTNELLEKKPVEPLSSALQAYLQVSQDLVSKGRIFS